MVDAIVTLRPVLQLALLVAVIWLAAQVLRRVLLGRVGEFGKLMIFGGLVGVYALTVVLTATGGQTPWAPVMGLLLQFSPMKALIVVVSVLMVWLIARESFMPMPHQLGFLLDSPVRRLLAPADAVFHWMALGPGMRVVEVGCGTGHLSGDVARRIEPGGMLFCVDIQPEMVDKTLKRVEAQGLNNVLGFVAPADKLPLDVYDIDVVFLVHVLGEIPDRLPALREALRVLRPGGVLSITEALIDPHYRFRNDVVKLCHQAGFELASIEGSLFNYTATFRKPQPREPLGYAPRFD
jgi:SAM-dependent methyltransferase